MPVWCTQYVSDFGPLGTRATHSKYEEIFWPRNSILQSVQTNLRNGIFEHYMSNKCASIVIYVMFTIYIYVNFTVCAQTLKSTPAHVTTCHTLPQSWLEGGISKKRT